MGVFDKFLDIMKLNDDEYDDDDFYDDGGSKSARDRRAHRGRQIAESGRRLCFRFGA